MRSILGIVSSVTDAHGFIDAKYDENLNEISEHLFFHYSKLRDLKLQIKSLGIKIDYTKYLSEELFPWVRDFFKGIPVVCALTPTGDKISQVYIIPYLIKNHTDKRLSYYYNLIKKCAEKHNDTLEDVLTPIALDTMAANYVNFRKGRVDVTNSISFIESKGYVQYNGIKYICIQHRLSADGFAKLAKLKPFAEGRFLRTTQADFDLIKGFDEPLPVCAPLSAYDGKWINPFVDPKTSDWRTLGCATIEELVAAYWKERGEEKLDFNKFLERREKRVKFQLSLLDVFDSPLVAKKKIEKEFGSPMEEHVNRIKEMTVKYRERIDRHIFDLIRLPLSKEEEAKINSFNKWYIELHND